MMRAFLAAVFSVIALGCVLIAYGLLSPRVATAQAYGGATGFDGARAFQASDPRSAESLALQNDPCPCRAGYYNGAPGVAPTAGYPYDVRAIPAYQSYP